MKPLKMFLFGDSTMSYNSCLTYPQTGWGQVLPLFCTNFLTIVNLAKNGRSSKTFYEEGLYKPVLTELNPGDYVVIQFGHNDQKVNTERFTSPFGTYQEYLLKLINIVRNKGGIIILLSPIYRRYFDCGILRPNVHLNYPDAMKALAKDENVYYIDMTQLTFDLLKEVGDERSKFLFMNLKPNQYINYPDGLVDNTHLVYEGAYQIARLFVETAQVMIPNLDLYFNKKETSQL